MTQTTPSAQRLPLAQRIVYGIPLLGPVIRRISQEIAQDVNNVFYLLVAFITAEIVAFQIWGPVVFTLTALVLVPLMFLFFIFISWPSGTRRKD